MVDNVTNTNPAPAPAPATANGAINAGAPGDISAGTGQDAQDLADLQAIDAADSAFKKATKLEQLKHGHELATLNAIPSGQ